MCVEEVPGGGPEGAALVHIVEPMRDVDRFVLFFVCESCRRTRVMRVGEDIKAGDETLCPSCKSTLCTVCELRLSHPNRVAGTRGADLSASIACGAKGPADVVLLHIANHMHGTTALPVVCSGCGTMALPTWGEPVVCPRHPDARVCGPCADLLVRLFAFWVETIRKLDVALMPRGTKVETKALGIDREALEVREQKSLLGWPSIEAARAAGVASSVMLGPAAPTFAAPAPPIAWDESCTCEWSTTCFGTGRRQCWGCSVVGDPLRTTAKCRCACGGFRTCHGCPDCARPADRGGP